VVAEELRMREEEVRRSNEALNEEVRRIKAAFGEHIFGLVTNISGLVTNISGLVTNIFGLVTNIFGLINTAMELWRLYWSSRYLRGLGGWSMGR
jgi:phage-related protein